MPWKPSDASGKIRKATTPKKRRQWARVANKTLAEDGSEGKAIRIANATLAEGGGRSR